MKLKKILKYIDGEIDIRLWVADAPSSPDDAFGIAFEGMVSEVPKKYKNYYLIKTEDNHDCGAICPYNIGRLPCLRLTIVKNKE